MFEQPPLSLYVHIPWCLRKCPYCDFNSHEARGEVPEAAYVDALLSDLESSLESVWGRRVLTIFIGGGTPSLFTPETIDRLLIGIRTRMTVDPSAEITLEANPGTFEMQRFRGYRDAGVNRLSVGVQSFDDAALGAIGRVHGGAEARRALQAAVAIFPTVNADLMYALPGQAATHAVADVREAVAIGVSHLSAYHLTLEPDTHFHRFPPQLPDEDAAADMQEAIEAVLARASFEHYETSAFARPGHRARHNVNYWTFGDYVGIGAGAHGKLTFADPTARPSTMRIVRERRARKPQTYMQLAMERRAIDESHAVARPELPFEFMLNALRLVDGFDAALFERRTGLPLATIAKPLAIAQERGLLERDHVSIRPTQKGRRFLNDLLELFLPENTPPRRTIAISTSPTGTRPT